ncbi:MAG: RidA family protein [Alphaproteobacteria bacterium]
MQSRPINAADGPAAQGGYAQAFEVQGASRILYISGQIPMDGESQVPHDFEGQARLVWKNVERQLVTAQMGLENLVKVTTFLAHRDHRIQNRTIRQAVLGAHTPALTVIICEIFEEAWLLEIEAIAMA